MKLACVVQRYGAGIAGGSERHCRELALRLTARHDVTVLTTCAADYVTWANEFPAGVSMDGPVHVRRFPVRRPRRLKRFAELSDDVFDGRASIEWYYRAIAASLSQTALADHPLVRELRDTVTAFFGPDTGAGMDGPPPPSTQTDPP